jgi:hypothetical protein
MSDFFKTLQEEANKGIKTLPCRVAYTLNNAQPVACTIIGEQPLFYMDYEDAIDDGDGILDEDFFTEDDLELLKEEIHALKDQIQSFEKFSSEFTQSSEAQMDAFLENATSSFASTETADLNLEAVLETLRKSRLASEYVSFAQDHGVDIVLSAQIENGEYNRKSSKIFINNRLDETEAVLVLAQTLRMHWQHRKGALIEPLMFHPDQAVLVNRAQVADLSVSVIRIAWELQLSGYRAAWERIENSTLSDLARAFAREAFMDFRTVNNGEAAAAIFEAWFLSERCRAQDKILIQKMLADTKGYVFDLDEASKSVTPDLIAALGEMPYGKNYLAQHVDTIMDDTIFTDIRDRSNANFLWFIKFERTFRDAEDAVGTSSAQHLQSSPAGSDAHQIHNTPNEASHDSAQIVTIFGTKYDPDTIEKQTKAAQKKGKKRLSSAPAPSQDAEIIYLRGWSGE